MAAAAAMIFNEADEALEKHPFPFWTTYASVISSFPVCRAFLNL
jgi:hypothetical protein